MTFLEELARRRAHDVLSTAVSITIEKIAAEAASAILADPAFREELRALAREQVGRAKRNLQRPVTRRTPARRRKAR